MPTTYIVKVFADGALAPEASAKRVEEALWSVASTSTFHGAAWAYPGPDRALGALVTFDVGLASPFAGSAPRLLRALRAALHVAVGPRARLDVSLLDADRADWFSEARRTW